MADLNIAPEMGDDKSVDWECPICHGTQSATVHALMHRVGSDTSFANLWARLDRAERDRDRMLNALQYAMDAAARDGGKMKPRDIQVLRRAIRRVSEIHRVGETPHDL